jgi:hypothetical protein
MIDNSYYIILNRLKAFANGHYLINTFTYHEIANFDISKNPEYPIMHAVPVSMNPVKGAINYSFDITFASWVRAKEEKQENEVTVISDMHRCALDLVTEITNGNILFGSDVSIDGDAVILPFIDEFANVLSGVTLQLTIQIPYDWSACDIPANWVEGTGDIPDFGGRSLTLDVLDEGTFVVAAREMDFRGSAVTVTYEGNKAIVTITGGGGGGAVDSVNGQTGVVVLDADDINETATRGWLTSILKSAYDGAVTWISTNGTNLINHLSNTSNPHNTTQGQVGLGNVDNTSDLDKPVSTAQQTEIDTKEDAIAAGTTSQYWRGDKSWQTLDKSAVGLGNVDNTSDADKPISTATQTALDAINNRPYTDTIRAGTTIPASTTRWLISGLSGFGTSAVLNMAERAVHTTFRVTTGTAQPANGSLTITREFTNLVGTVLQSDVLTIPASSPVGVYEFTGASFDATAINCNLKFICVNNGTSSSAFVQGLERAYTK